jgi:hypothetical protein
LSTKGDEVEPVEILGVPRWKLEGAAAAAEVVRILDVAGWPAGIGPWLHVKRYVVKNTPQLGLLHAADLDPLVSPVRVFGPLDASVLSRLNRSTPPEQQLPVMVSYATVTDLVDNGWMAH